MNSNVSKMQALWTALNNLHPGAENWFYIPESKWINCLQLKSTKTRIIVFSSWDKLRRNYKSLLLFKLLGIWCTYAHKAFNITHPVHAQHLENLNPEMKLAQDQLIYFRNTSRNVTNQLGIPICKLHLLYFLAAAASFSFCLHILASSLAQSLSMALQHLQNKQKTC